MNALDPINLSIEFVKQTVDPGGGGGEFVNAQTGDIAIWAILAILFVGVIAYCMFRFSRVFNGEYVTAAASPKHAKNAHRGGRLATTKAVLIAAIVGLIACLSITTTTAIASSNHANSLIQPDKIQVAINEETGEVDAASFNFVNTTNDYYLFEKSSVSLTEEAAKVSESSDWSLTLNGMSADLFKGEPNGETQTIESSVQTLYPGQSSSGTLTFITINPEIAKQLIGKTVFNVTLNPDQYVITTPKAETGLVYDGTTLTGVKGGVGYALSQDYQATNAGSYTAVATPIDSYKWPDKSHAGIQIPWSIAKATGGFLDQPTPINPIYNAEDQILVTDGTPMGDGDIVYKLKGSSDPYTTDRPKQTNAGIYTVLAHVNEGTNYTQSEDVEIQNATIQKAKIEKITIHGEKVDYDYVAGDRYIFPDYAKGKVAYTASCEMRAGDPYVFKDSYIDPKPNDSEKIKPIEIISATEADIKTHYLGLTSINFTYTDPNVDVTETEWINNDDACMTINKKPIVEMTVTPTTSVPGQVQIGETVSYSVSIENISDDDIYGASLYFGVDMKFDNISISKGSTYTTLDPITYTVTASDFDYPPTMDKYFTFTFGSETPYYKYVVNRLTLSYKSVTWPVLQPIDYDGNPHKFPSNDGYTIIFGGEEQTNAGTYYTFAMLNPGYHWADWDQYQIEYRFSAWTINKISLNVHLTMPPGMDHFEATFGDVWSVDQHPIIGTTSDGKTIQGDALKAILDGEPSCLTQYEQYSDVKVEPYKLVVNLPPSTGWNPNYNITKDDANLVVLKKNISIIWPITKTFKYTGEKLTISITINGNLPDHSAVVKVETFTDSAREIQKDFIDKGDYYATAMLSGEADRTNYKITEGTDKPSDVFKITDTPTPPLITEDSGKATIDESGTLIFYVEGEITPTNEEWNVPKDGTNIPWTSSETFRNSIKNIETTEYFQTWLGLYVTSTKAWFKQLNNVIQIDVSNWNTKLVTDMSEMFDECENLGYVNVSGMDTSAAVNMSKMFNECSNLSNIVGIKNINVSSASDLSYLFSFCNLRTFDGTQWNVANVENFSYMFQGNTGINVVDLNTWNVSNGITFEGMFGGCRSSVSIDIRNFKLTTKATSVASMFVGCYSLTRIYCDGDWRNLSNLEDYDLFAQCYRLPDFDAMHDGKEKAYKGSGGYFSQYY